jgi:hypothetical protein
MSPFIFILFYFVDLIITFAHADNPSSIVPPMNLSDPGYILAESTSGLSNRLRVMAAYMHIGEAKFEGAHLIFIWDKTEACPGHFLSLFEPIPSVVFATNNSRYVLDKNAKIVYENSFAVFSWIMMQNGIPKNRAGFPTWGTIEYNMYSRYFPVREVMSKVIAFVDLHNMCNSSAMHIRQTDLDGQMNERKRTNLNSYFKFVESRSVGEVVFLLCDSPDTQRLFLQKYNGTDGAKVIVYQEIASAAKQTPLILTNKHDVNSNNRTLSVDHRFTSLEHTLIDVLIAAHALHFKASPFSSLSELVKTFEHIGKKDRGWCK